MRSPCRTMCSDLLFAGDYITVPWLEVMVTRLVATILLVLGCIGCSDDDKCPFDTEKVSGICQLVGPTYEGDYALPKAAEVKAEDSRQPRLDASMDADPDGGIMGEVQEDITAGEVLHDLTGTDMAADILIDDTGPQPDGLLPDDSFAVDLAISDAVPEAEGIAEVGIEEMIASDLAPTDVGFEDSAVADNAVTNEVQADAN